MEIEILNDDTLRSWCSRIEIPAEGAEELARIAGDVRTDPVLLGIFTDLHEKTAVRGEWFQDWSSPMPTDPRVEQRYGPHGTTLFYLLGYMAALPFTEREYQRRGIDPRIFHDTFLDIGIWMKRGRQIYGEWCFRQFPWIRLHFECLIFRLGRLQFVLKPFEDQTLALRSRTTGEIVLLCDPTTPLRADGYALGAGIPEEAERPAESEGWRAAQEEREDGWLGHPVSPYGYALKEPCFYARTDWEVALAKGDTILDMHIPRGERMTVEECRDSLQQAYAFFAQQAPDRPFKAGFCHTWFFTPQLQRLLTPESNIVRFQREFYLYPYAGGPGFLWDYVFGSNISDVALAPRDNSMRRAVLDWLAQGGELFDLPGLTFHGPEAWGSQPYMSTTRTPYPY